MVVTAEDAWLQLYSKDYHKGIRDAGIAKVAQPCHRAKEYYKAIQATVTTEGAWLRCYWADRYEGAGEAITPKVV